MTLEERINKDLVTAMKAKDDVTLRGIRAIKSAIQLARTDGSGNAIDEAREVAMVQKLVKTRQESFDIYTKNNRPELAEKEREEIEIIKRYLPAMSMPADGQIDAAFRQHFGKVGVAHQQDADFIGGQ